MKSILALAFTFASASAFAGATHTHINSRTMSCAAVQNAVSVNGSVILHYGNGLYERVVAHGGYCDHASDEVAEAFWAPSADDAQCFAGYVCEPSSGRGGGGN